MTQETEKKKHPPGLVLSIREDGAFFIGDNVRVTILGHKGKQVRVLISAPKAISVLREEVFAAEHGQEAANQVGTK